MSRKHLSISFLSLCFYTAKTQDFYRMEGNIIFKYDLNTSCEGVEEFDFKNSDLEVIPNNIPIHFHPDGHIYIPGPSRRVNRYHPVRKDLNQKIVLNTSQPINQMSISEEGRIILSNHSNSLTEIYEYDLRQNKIKHTFDKNSISGGLLPEADLNFVGGILKDGFFLIPTRITRESKLGMWNPETGETRTFPIELGDINRFMASSILYPPCGDLNVYALVHKMDDFSEYEFGIASGDTIGNNMEYLCKFGGVPNRARSEEHTSELQSRGHLVCQLLPEKNNSKMES